jgi:hypothetical protein
MAAPNPLPEPQVFLLTTIYEGLKERGTWPPFQFVDTVLDRDGHDIDQVVDGLPPDLSNLTPGVRHVSGDDEVTLTIAGLYYCRNADTDIGLFLEAVSNAVVLERSLEPSVQGGERPTLRSSELAKTTGASAAALQRLHLFIRYEPWGGGGGSNAEGWEMQITRAIRRFRAVKGIEDYLSRRAEFFGQAARIPPAVRLGLKPGTILGAEPEQKEGKYIFVIMPLKADFDAVYKTIRAACAKFPGVSFDRSDDLTQTGRITDQIISALKDADIVIADITDQNPNVMYELGFAHALGKKVIVLNAGQGSPFDVADYRQILFAISDLPSAEESLTRFVQTGLGIEPNR